MSEKLQGQARTSMSTSIAVKSAGEDFIDGSYSTLRGNSPNAYGNCISIWPADGTSVPWNTAPLNTQFINTNTPDGSFAFTNLRDQSSYIIGYSVGPALSGGSTQPNGNVCAWVFVTNGSVNDTFSPEIAVRSITPTSILISYSLPEGATPRANGAWIGVWSSGTPRYMHAPDAAVAIQSDNSHGHLAINFYVVKGQQYTIALFTSGYAGGDGRNRQTAMAACVTVSG